MEGLLNLKLFVKSNRNLETTEALFYNYYPRLCDFARKFLNDAAMAEDVVQDVFVAICERREPLPEAEFAVKGLLYVAVRNACYNKLRHQKVVHQHQASQLISEASDPEILEAIISSEVMAIMMEAIASLPAGCAEVVRKGFMEGLSNAELSNSVSPFIPSKARNKGLYCYCAIGWTPILQVSLFLFFSLSEIFFHSVPFFFPARVF